ncbi:MAG: Fe(3+) ABC transporter substrate-binding protein [Magnetococcales bacterium]|nr:Fe(3+) ABC transporter substrate-binding protein [Magnetococcales bacterium]NGZ28458.1 Fe(3+) ABC transporter substrate-binding protein [Magnetococcales bacterium]
MFFLGLALMFSASAMAADEEVVIYSARKDHLIKPILDAYEKSTGGKSRFLTDDAAPLLARLKAEGENTPADMLLTVDVGNLWNAAQEGVLSPVDSKTLTTNIPAYLRDPNNTWFGLTIRARTLVIHKDRVKENEISTYEGLAQPHWKNRLCLRSSKKVYNQSLVAMLINRMGEEKTEAMVKGWVANLAQPVFSNDTQVMEAIAAGQCDVGIVNTYYYGELMAKKPDLPLTIFWPNQQDQGVHINISGAAITKHAKHKAAAIKLLEWFSSSEAQRLFADLNKEYPVNPAVDPTPEVSAWGTFKADTQNLEAAGKNQAKAVMLMDRAGYK